MRREAAAALAPVLAAITVLVVFWMLISKWATSTNTVLLAAMFAVAVPIGIAISALLAVFLHPFLTARRALNYATCISVPAALAAIIAYVVVGLGESFLALTIWAGVAGAYYFLLHGEADVA